MSHAYSWRHSRKPQDCLVASPTVSHLAGGQSFDVPARARRNRRIAEAFAKCGLVERSGQGANRMFEECIKRSKALPDFSGTDDFQLMTFKSALHF